VSDETIERKALAYDRLVELMGAGHVLAMAETMEGGGIRFRAAQAGTVGGEVAIAPLLADAVEALHARLMVGSLA
jgi:hypothetical protein